MMKTLFVLILLIAGTLNAKPLDINAYCRTDRDTALIGDHITLTLVIESSGKTDLILPEISENLGQFEVLNDQDIDTVSKGNKYVLEKKYELICFDTGKYEIPPLTVMFNRPDMDSYYPVETKPVNIIIKGVPVGKEIIDIKPPLEEPVQWYEYLSYLLILIPIGLIAVTAYYIKKYLDKKKSALPAPVKKEIPKVPAHVLAFAALDKLEKDELWQNGFIKEYYTGLSEISRTYIENRFDIPAMEMSSHEIIDLLSDIINDGSGISDLEKLFELSDLSKFAKFRPGEDENKHAMEIALKFITRTKEDNTRPVPDTREAE